MITTLNLYGLWECMVQSCVHIDIEISKSVSHHKIASWLLSNAHQQGDNMFGNIHLSIGLSVCQAMDTLTFKPFDFYS